MGDLALRRHLTPSGITRNVERLEQDGLITRETDHSDGRAYQAALTPQGLARLREATPRAGSSIFAEASY